MNDPASHLPNELSPEQEERRVQALRRYDILDTPPDGSFDRITTLAARLLSVPIAIVTLVDRDRIWFKSKQGVEVGQIGRDPGLCASAILQQDAWVLPDAAADPRVLSNPLVASEFGLRFYAGVPLRTWDGHNLGTLCVIDKQPREVSDDEISHLQDLASVVMDQMELRLAARSAVAQREMLLRELQHRVKNNLSILHAIVSSTQRRAESRETVEFMRALSGRLLTLGAAHDALQGAAASGSGRTQMLLERVAETVTTALGEEGRAQISIEDHELPNDLLLPLALILNELLTNALKYGLADGKGSITVDFHRTGEAYELSVRDSGPGFDWRENERGKPSGLSFVKGLAQQLRGQFEISNSGGCACLLRFPA